MDNVLFVDSASDNEKERKIPVPNNLKRPYPFKEEEDVKDEIKSETKMFCTREDPDKTTILKQELKPTIKLENGKGLFKQEIKKETKSVLLKKEIGEIILKQEIKQEFKSILSKQILLKKSLLKQEMKHEMKPNFLSILKQESKPSLVKQDEKSLLKQEIKHNLKQEIKQDIKSNLSKQEHGTSILKKESKPSLVKQEDGKSILKQEIKPNLKQEIKPSLLKQEIKPNLKQEIKLSLLKQEIKPNFKQEIKLSLLKQEFKHRLLKQEEIKPIKEEMDIENRLMKRRTRVKKESIKMDDNIDVARNGEASVSSVKNTHECCFCNYSSPFIGTMTRHIKFKHPGNSNLLCKYCDYSCSRIEYTLMQKHMSMHR